jgi:plasmid stability protein
MVAIDNTGPVLHSSCVDGEKMANLTLNIDDDLLRKARIRALEEGTSVNAAVRDFLARFADDERSARGLESFLEVARRSSASSGESGRRWTRDSLYDR